MRTKKEIESDLRKARKLELQVERRVEDIEHELDRLFCHNVTQKRKQLKATDMPAQKRYAMAKNYLAKKGVKFNTRTTDNAFTYVWRITVRSKIIKERDEIVLLALCDSRSNANSDVRGFDFKVPEGK